jgi:hypothetical protein
MGGLPRVAGQTTHRLKTRFGKKFDRGGAIALFLSEECWL